MFCLFIILVIIILLQFFLLCWGADSAADTWESLSEALPYVPDNELSEEERAECMAHIDKLIPKLRRMGAWTKPMQGPLRRLNEKLERYSL